MWVIHFVLNKSSVIITSSLFIIFFSGALLSTLHYTSVLSTQLFVPYIYMGSWYNNDNRRSFIYINIYTYLQAQWQSKAIINDIKSSKFYFSSIFVCLWKKKSFFTRQFTRLFIRRVLPRQISLNPWISTFLKLFLI